MGYNLSIWIFVFVLLASFVSAASVTDTMLTLDPRTYTLDGRGYIVESKGQNNDANGEPIGCDYKVKDVNYPSDTYQEYTPNLVPGKGYNFKILIGSIEHVTHDKNTKTCTFKLSTNPATDPINPTCQNQCSNTGIKTCQGNTVYECVSIGGCLVNSPRDICNYPSQICQESVGCVVNVNNCVDLCSYSGKKWCENGVAYTCGQYDSDSCLDQDAKVCDYGYVCKEGQGCIKLCTDACSSDYFDCLYTNLYHYCKFNSQTGCYEKKQVSCNDGYICSETKKQCVLAGTKEESRESSCTQETISSTWSECVNGERTRQITYKNYQNICGKTYSFSQQDFTCSPEPNIASVELPKNQLNCPSDNTPVVFVHGWGSDASAFDEMDELFKKCGIRTHRDTTNNVNPDLIKNRAIILRNQIDEFKRETGAKKVNIIAHSMGGLISRYYIKYLNGNSFVDKLIMLGTPNHGSNLAVYDSEDAKLIDTITAYDNTKPEPDANHITTQMMVGSDFLSELNSPTETYGYVGYYTIRGTLDSVVSLDSAKLTGVDGDRIVPCDHTLVKSIKSPTKCPESYNAILDFLGGAVIKTGQISSETTTGMNRITSEVVKEIVSRVDERVEEIEDVAVTTGRVVEIVVNEKDNSNFVDVVVGWFKSVTRFLW